MTAEFEKLQPLSESEKKCLINFSSDSEMGIEMGKNGGGSNGASKSLMSDEPRADITTEINKFLKKFLQNDWKV